MRTTVLQRPTSRVHRHYGAWRALLAAPAIIASTALLLALVGFLGTWEPVALLAWLTLAAATCLRPVEQIVARVTYRLHRPDCEQRTLLDPPWREALARAGHDVNAVDLYMCRSPTANAYALGTRSVAVTTELLDHVHADHISHHEFVGILLHEVGHIVTNATTFGLARAWLSAPWRIASRATYRVATACTSRRQPLWLLAGLACLAFTIAIGHAAQAHNWPVAALLSALISCTVAAPLADAAISRSSEHAADRYVADTGLGADLATAITVLDRAQRGHKPASRWLAPHPRTDAASKHCVAVRSRAQNDLHPFDVSVARRPTAPMYTTAVPGQDDLTRMDLFRNVAARSTIDRSSDRTKLPRPNISEAFSRCPGRSRSLRHRLQRSGPPNIVGLSGFAVPACHTF